MSAGDNRDSVMQPPRRQALPSVSRACEQTVEDLPPDEIVRASQHSSPTRAFRQHRAVVEFGQLALGITSLQSLLNEACSAVAAGLHSRFVKVLRYVPDRNHLLVVAGIGWPESEIGFARLSADGASPAGYAVENGKPVLSNHLESEIRFRTPALLEKYGIKRAINVPIRGTPVPFGVLEADSPEGEDFIESDVVFVEGIANIVALTIERLDAEQHDHRADELSASILEASQDCIVVMTPDSRIVSINARGRQQLELAEASESVGAPWEQLWAEESRGAATHAATEAASGSSTRFEASRPAADGSVRWWDVSVAPVIHRAGHIEHLVAVCRDITERHLHEVALDELIASQGEQLDQSGDMMKEVHHRVRNSLQLVQTLLALQASLTPEPVVKAQLEAASVRVMTVGAVHQRLYQDNGAKVTDASDYLFHLIDDLKGVAAGREIRFHASTVMVAANRLSPLGLITAELVTNSIKYGRGDIDVSLTQLPDALVLTVEDQGTGVPDTFPSPQGTGLGLRLIQSYAGFGRDSLSVDRSVSHTKFDVRFRA